MASTTQKWTPSSRQYRDERSPNTISQPLRIPDGRIYKPFPPILLDRDTTAGMIHHRSETIADYTPWHSALLKARKIKDEEQITARRAPPCWVDRVGVAPPPGFGPGKLLRKEVRIVPDLGLPWDNKGGMNRLKWEGEERRREKEEEGYESVGEPVGKGVYVGKQEEDEEYSVWSC